jgi:hypothetical protein
MAPEFSSANNDPTAAYFSLFVHSAWHLGIASNYQPDPLTPFCDRSPFEFQSVHRGEWGVQ